MISRPSIICPCGCETPAHAPHSHRLGHIIRDQDMTACFETPAEQIADFFRACQEGRRQVWVEEFYGQTGFDLQNENVILDILLRRHSQMLLTIFQCDQCGRISIERAPSTLLFRTFEPEDRDWEGVLGASLGDVLHAGGSRITFAEDKRGWWKFW